MGRNPRGSISRAVALACVLQLQDSRLRAHQSRYAFHCHRRPRESLVIRDLGLCPHLLDLWMDWVVRSYLGVGD